MGRRNRSKRNRHDDDDGDDDEGLERAEREWLNRRTTSAASNKRRKTNGDEAPPTSKRDVDGTASNDAIATKPQHDAEAGSKGAPKEDGNASAEQDKIERMKLKKQLQKERRREKKANAAAAAATTKQTQREAKRELQAKQRQENEKKKKLKEKGRSQQFTTLAKGVQYQDLIVGNGPTVQHRKKIRVSYVLRAKSHTSGKIIDSSRNYGFRLGKGEVIQGYDIGLQGMRVGGTRRLIVPPAAGYGNRDVGAGRGADLYFEIELLYVAP